MIILTNVSKSFPTGTVALSDVSVHVEKGEFVFLVGHTGSGKTTLLKLLIREILPSTGTIRVADFELTKLPKNKIPKFRKKIGIVFQDLKLLMDRTILENVLLPLEITGKKGLSAIARAEEVLSQVKMSEHRNKFPIQLSGGELQRVAIARALALSPEILLADEPTGNLDMQTAFDITQLLDQINKLGTTIIMATHNMDILKKYPKNRILGLDSGKLTKDQKHQKQLASLTQMFKEDEHNGAHKSEIKEHEDAIAKLFAPKNDEPLPKEEKKEHEKKEGKK